MGVALMGAEFWVERHQFSGACWGAKLREFSSLRYRLGVTRRIRVLMFPMRESSMSVERPHVMRIVSALEQQVESGNLSVLNRQKLQQQIASLRLKYAIYFD
jgi:hypothetical protein